MEKRKNLLLIIGALLIGIVIGSNTSILSRDDWSGVYYPNGDSTGSGIYSPKFDTKEECIGWAVNELGFRPEDKNVPLQDLWECSKNCKIDSSYRQSVNHSQSFILENNLGISYVCKKGFDGGDWLRGDY